MKNLCICRLKLWKLKYNARNVPDKIQIHLVGSVTLSYWCWGTTSPFCFRLCSAFKRTAQYLTERPKSEWIYTLGRHPSIFTETGTAAPRSSLLPTVPWQIVCFTLFTSSRLSSEKRHDNLLCAHWRWIVITPQAMQMLLSASRSRPVLPPAGRVCLPSSLQPQGSPTPHIDVPTYLATKMPLSVFRELDPEIPVLTTIWTRKFLSFLSEICLEHSS
jgi:hypothetical protein